MTSRNTFGSKRKQLRVKQKEKSFYKKEVCKAESYERKDKESANSRKL